METHWQTKSVHLHGNNARFGVSVVGMAGSHRSGGGGGGGVYVEYVGAQESTPLQWTQSAWFYVTPVFTRALVY